MKGLLCRSMVLVGVLFAGQLGADWQQPLTADEISRSVGIARYSRPVDRTRLSSDFGNAAKHNVRSPLTNTRAHPLGVQILLVELREQKKPLSESRLVEVFLFNYDRRVAELNVIDIDQGALISTTDIDTAHLPLSDTEIEYSRSLIWNHDELKARVRHELSLLQTGGVGEDLSRLQARVSIWVPQSTDQSGASGCDRERCAFISLFTENDYSFSVEPVVNLISGEIYIDLVR